MAKDTPSAALKVLQGLKSDLEKITPVNDDWSSAWTQIEAWSNRAWPIVLMHFKEYAQAFQFAFSAPAFVSQTPPSRWTSNLVSDFYGTTRKPTNPQEQLFWNEQLAKNLQTFNEHKTKIASCLQGMIESEEIKADNQQGRALRSAGTSLLQNEICEAFVLDELRNLISDLGEDSESVADNRVPVETLCRSTVEYFERRNRLIELIEACKTRRPKRNWDRFLTT